MAAAARTPETLSTNINQEEGRLRSGGSTPTRPTTATCCKDASKRRSDATETAAANICTRRKTVPGSLRHALFFGNIPLKAGCPCSIMQEDHARIQSQQAATWAPIRVLPKTHQLLGILFLNTLQETGLEPWANPVELLPGQLRRTERKLKSFTVLNPRI